MAAATSYGTHAMARPAAGQWALLAPKAPSPLLSVSLRGGAHLRSCAVSFSGSLTPASPAHGIARLIARAHSTGSQGQNQNSNAGAGGSSDEGNDEPNHETEQNQNSNAGAKGSSDEGNDEPNHETEQNQNSNAGAGGSSNEGNDEPNHETANVIMTHSKLICCKFYISATCNTDAIDAIDKEARSDPNKVVVLSKFGDSIYNRVRYTLVSYISESSKTSPHDKSVTTIEVIRPIRKVLLKMVKVAFEQIEKLEGHSGTHPRMGVIDDLSFHPLGDANMEDAASLARLVASDIGGIEYRVPVFLYGEAHPERKTLGAIRSNLGCYDSNSDVDVLAKLRKTTPDNGIVNDNAADLNYDRGATTVGAAPFLEGYNVPLRYKDNIKKVRRIVTKLREQLRGGREGLPKFLAKELFHGECIEIGCLFDSNYLRADQIQDMVRKIAEEEGLEDKVEKGYYTDITKEMILVNLYSKLFTAADSSAAPPP